MRTVRSNSGITTSMKTLWVMIVFLLIVSLAFLEVAAMRVEPATAPIEDAQESPFPFP